MILSHHLCYMTLSYADGEAEGMDVELAQSQCNPGIQLETSRDNSVMWRTETFRSTI